MTQHTIELIVWASVAVNLLLAAANGVSLVATTRMRRGARTRIAQIDEIADRAIAADIETQANLAESRAILARLTPGWKSPDE